MATIAPPRQYLLGVLIALAVVLSIVFYIHNLKYKESAREKIDKDMKRLLELYVSHDDRKYLDLIVAKLSGGNDAERSIAAKYLGECGARAIDALPALVVSVTSDRQSVRKSAAMAIARIGPVASSSTPDLMRVITQYPHDDVVSLCIVAIGEVARPDDESVRSFLEGLPLESHGNSWGRAQDIKSAIRRLNERRDSVSGSAAPTLVR